MGGARRSNVGNAMWFMPRTSGLLKDLSGTGYVSPVAWATEISGPFR